MIIETNQLGKKFGAFTAIENLSLNVPEGSAFALVGTNGAGKTTTLRLLMNILRPDSGYAKVLGIDSKTLRHKDYNQIGYVSENQLIPHRLTIEEYFKYLRKLYTAWDQALETELVEKLNLPIKRQLGKLSHGMRMKTVLIAGLAFRPKLLLLDEPLSGMDTLTRDEVIEGLLEQAGETTIVISSHELAEIENFTSHIAFMNKGILHLQESIDSLKGRFREVDVKLSNRKSIPDGIPTNWLFPNISGHKLTFIETEFQDSEKLYQQLAAHFGAIQLSVEPMSLREISNVLIKFTRKAETEVQFE